MVAESLQKVVAASEACVVSAAKAGAVKTAAKTMAAVRVFMGSPFGVCYAVDGGKHGNLHEAFYHGNDAAVGGVAVETAGDFVALHRGLAVVRQAAVGGGEVRAVARAVVFVRQ